MCSLRPIPSRPRDRAEALSSALGLMATLGLAFVLGDRVPAGPLPGSVPRWPDEPVRLSLAAPATPVQPEQTESEPVLETPPNPVPVVESEPEPTVEPIEPAPPEEPPPEETEAELTEPEVPMASPATAIEAGWEGSIREEWLAALWRRIEQNKFYPMPAYRAGAEGLVLLRVKISSAAEIAEVEIVRRSGSPLLDEAALALLRRVAASPLSTNRLPEAVSVEVPIRYQISAR